MQHGVIGGDPYVPGVPRAERSSPMRWTDGGPMRWESGDLMRWERGDGIEYA